MLRGEHACVVYDMDDVLHATAASPRPTACRTVSR